MWEQNLWLLFETIKVGLTYKELGIPYIWGQLNANGLLMEKVILAALGFGALLFIVCSKFLSVKEWHSIV